jgi:hypothetical protein
MEAAPVSYGNGAFDSRTHCCGHLPDLGLIKQIGEETKGRGPSGAVYGSTSQSIILLKSVCRTEKEYATA